MCNDDGKEFNNIKNFSDPAKNIEEFDLNNGMNVVDMGAGSGRYSIAMSKEVGESGKVYAVDVQKNLLINIKNEADKKNIKNIEIVWGDIEEAHGTGIADNFADFVLVSNTLFQAEDTNKLLREARRILKPGGHLAVIEWKESFGGLGPPENCIVKKNDLLNIMKEFGFSVKKEFDSGAYHYCVIFYLNN